MKIIREVYIVYWDGKYRAEVSVKGISRHIPVSYSTLRRGLKSSNELRIGEILVQRVPLGKKTVINNSKWR